METKQKNPTDTSTALGTTMAFTEWLHGKRSYIILVQGEDGEDNLCCIDGDIPKLTNTLANGMLQHEVLKGMVMKACTLVLRKRMKDLGIDWDFPTPDV